ncbi:hypothetical protein L1887_55287 [Cichorium endivia]|nr:hypothetical protein L1887_55287 [Cichorium endivia]
MRRLLSLRKPTGDEFDELFDHAGDLTSDSAPSDNDGEYTGNASTSRAARRKKGSSKILELGHILKAPRAAQFSTSTIYNMIKEDIVDLEPEYQRGVVWPADKQSAVIESIMRHYYVPPILLSVQKEQEAGGRPHLPHARAVRGAGQSRALRRMHQARDQAQPSGSSRLQAALARRVRLHCVPDLQVSRRDCVAALPTGAGTEAGGAIEVQGCAVQLERGQRYAPVHQPRHYHAGCRVDCGFASVRIEPAQTSS